VNVAIIIGRLTRDVELRYTQNGVPVARFTVAVNRSSGEGEADFIPVVAWRKLAGNCAQYIGKGRLVAVQGRLEVNRWEDENGVLRYKTEIVANNAKFLDRKLDAEDNAHDSGLLDGAQDVTDRLPPELLAEIDDVPF